MAIDYTHADVAWSQVCVTRLAESLNAGEIGLEKPALSSETTCPLRWERPPSHWAVLLLADALLNHDFDKELLQRDAGLRGLLEQALRWLATWILQIIREPSSENDASSPLMQAMAAQRGAMLYQRFYELRMRHIQGMLLQALLGNQVRSAIVLGVDLLVDCPPHSWQDSSLAISSLVQSEHWKVDDVYPRRVSRRIQPRNDSKTYLPSWEVSSLDWGFWKKTPPVFLKAYRKFNRSSSTAYRLPCRSVTPWLCWGTREPSGNSIKPWICDIVAFGPRRDSLWRS